MVIDIRNYPSEFVVFALGNLLAAADKTTFVRFSIMDEANPGAFSLEQNFPLQPSEPHYAGRIAILVDEATLSSAEYTTMAFRIAPKAAVIGSQTAGADGNVSMIRLPYNMTTLMSGLGVFTPSGGQTQGIGLARDVEATPTIAGIAAGRDEVLEAGLRWILGSDVPQAEIEALAKR
jgi:C-terminal processing protease CtpA/Prc